MDAKLCFHCNTFKPVSEFEETEEKVCRVCKDKGRLHVEFSKTDSKSQFSALMKGPFMRKVTVMGEKLWNDIFLFDPDYQGWFLEITGMPRSGKTSLMGHMAKKIYREQPDCRIFWQEPVNKASQAQKLGLPLKFLYSKHMTLEVFDLNSGKVLSESEYDNYNLEVHGFASVKHCWQLADKRKINVVYMDKMSRWVNLYEYCESPEVFRFWVAFFFDEFDKLCPGWAKGKDWYRNKEYADTITDSMKSNIYTFYDTQSVMGVDPRVRSKLMAQVYLEGAKTDNLSPVKQYAVQNLEKGQGYVDVGRGKFGLISYKPMLPVDNPIAVKTTLIKGRTKAGRKRYRQKAKEKVKQAV